MGYVLEVPEARSVGTGRGAAASAGVRFVIFADTLH